jgi:hypothetical protein
MSKQNSNWIWIIIFIFVLYKCSTSNDHKTAPLDSKTYGSKYNDYQSGSSSEDVDQDDIPDGDFDCTATNLISGNGPYSLNCEKDGDDIIINFPNGGHITVDEDGFHSETGDNWDIEKE